MVLSSDWNGIPLALARKTPERMLSAGRNDRSNKVQLNPVMWRKVVKQFSTMTWFNKSAAVAESEPIETDVDRLAKCEAERIFSESAYDLAVKKLRTFNAANVQMPFSFTTGDVTRIQTMVNSAERKFLERQVRLTLARRNEALSARGDLMMRMGLIR